MRVTVEVEDQIHSPEPPDNGSGPLWCHGSTIVARYGDAVYVAGRETLAGEVPLNNTRWVLFRRQDDGKWELVNRDETGRTREPSPIAVLASGDLFVSANPTVAPAGEYCGPAEPTMFRFDASDPGAEPGVESPVWHGAPGFTEHSYRTFSADGQRGEILYLQNEGYELAHMSLLSGGHWHGRGQLRWPFAPEYPEAQPLRLCYPNVMLRDGAAHFLGVGDIVEPIADWRAAKKEITGRGWDYVFRRLFYTATSSVADEPFGDWLELANRDATAGATHNCDLWIDLDGAAHALWIDETTDARIRDRFFAGVELRTSLMHTVIRDGRVDSQQTLAGWGEGEQGLRPQVARLHLTASGLPIILARFSAPAGDVYRVRPLLGVDSRWTDVPFARPLGGTLMLNTVRGGSAPCDTIDIIGTLAEDALGYARLHVSV